MVIGQHDPRKRHEYLTRRFNAGGKGFAPNTVSIDSLSPAHIALRITFVFGCLDPHMRGQRNTSRSQSLMRIAATRFLGVALLICSEVTVPLQPLSPRCI